MGAFLRRRLGVIVLGVVVLLLLSANRVATFLTDLWWYDNLGYRQVFTGKLVAQGQLFLVFGALLAVLVAFNLHWARKVRPLFIPRTQQEMLLERYRQQADPFLKWIIGGVALLFGVSAGGTAATQWESFLLWQNGGTFGVAEEQFGQDVGFYVFDLPWFSFVQSWLFTSLVLTLVVTVAAHVMLGGIRPDNEGDKVTAPVKRQLSFLLIAVLVVRAVGWWLDRFSLNFSPRGTVTGASFTDVNAELPALYLLIGLTVVAIGLIVWSLRRSGFLFAGAGIALLVVASLVLQGAYPALIQRLRVDPQEFEREELYIERNLVATRAAYDLTETELRQFAVDNVFTQQDLEDEATTLTNVRLWDPATLETTYSELQALRPYYKFNEVDVDRYMIDGELRQVMLSTRELDLAGLSAGARSWQLETLTYTHGLGVVSSKVNTADNEGQPVFLSRDLPPRGTEEVTPTGPEAGIYFGEASNPPYSIVNTDEQEIDYETGSGNEAVRVRYAGEGGVELGNRLRRFAYLLRFSDPNFLLSGLLNDDSRVLYRRDIQDRVQAIAPYLKLDADPYPVVLDGRILWLQDAYTTSANYPYAQRVDSRHGVLNYIRNSVKAVVDAYDGTVTLYVVEDDPIIQAWQKAFPGPYADVATAPAGLAEHFRYPQDLFRIQAEVYRTYHIPNAQQFYSKADEWQIPIDASTVANSANPETAVKSPLKPYYLLMKLPGEEREEFVLIQPYNPLNKPIMNGWLAGRSDPEHYGELFAVQFPLDQDVLGPDQVQTRIEQESEISEYITLRDRSGSKVIRGNMQIIPIGSSILYVEPLFIQGGQAQIPELDKVVVVLGERTVMEDTLEDALRAIVGAAPTTPDDEELAETEAELLAAAIQAFAEADQALRDGNLALYQAKLAVARRNLERAAELVGVDVEELLAPEPEPTDGPTESSTEPTTEPTGDPA